MPNPDESTEVLETETTEETATAETPEVTSEETPAPEVSTEKEGEGDEPTLSHEDALKALAKVRREAAEKRTQVRSLEEKLQNAKSVDEVEKIVADLKAEREKAENDLVRENVALKFKLPEDLATALQGASREELEAHAKVLAKYAPSEEADPDLEGGLRPGGDEDDGDPIAAAMNALKRRY